MRRILLALLFLGITSIAQAQCVAEVKDVIMDEQRGSIVIETEYKLNGIVVDPRLNPCGNCVGRTRYTEESGTIQQIVTKAKADIQQHCDNLIIRNAIKVNNLNGARLDIQKALTQPMISTLKANAVGWTKSFYQKVIQYKNKEITINADGSYTIADIP